MKNKLLVFSSFVFVLIILSCSPKPDYKIGVILSLTERGATFGNRAMNGINLALDEINQHDYFKNNKVNLYVEDSKSSATEAVSAFNKLLSVHSVPIVIGVVLSDEVLACAPIANEKKIVLLTTAAGSDKIKDAGDYIFRNRESGDVQVEELVKTAIQKMGIKQFCILYSNSANGVSYKIAFEKYVLKYGGKIDQSLGYSEGKNDYRAELGKLKRIYPKAIYLAGLDHELGLILKQSKELGLSTQYFASAGAISQKLLDIAGDGADGLICSSAAFDTSSNDRNVQQFIKNYKNKFNEIPDFIAANSYDAVMIISKIYSKGITDSEGIKKELYNLRNYPGVGGETTFDSFGEVYKPSRIVKVINKHFMDM